MRSPLTRRSCGPVGQRRQFAAVAAQTRANRPRQIVPSRSPRPAATSRLSIRAADRQWFAVRRVDQREKWFLIAGGKATPGSKKYAAVKTLRTRGQNLSLPSNTDDREQERNEELVHFCKIGR